MSALTALNATLSRRDFVAFASACAACAAAGSLPALAVADEPQTTLTIPVSATVTNLNRLLETMAEGWLQLGGFADELYFVDLDETRWYLAESCTPSEDGLTYTLKLRDGMTWHDGEAITADDVIFTMDCIANTNNGASYTNVAFIGEDAVSWAKVDDLTVEFTLPEASASFLELLGQVTPIPSHAFDGNTDIVSAEANLADIGSGPYKLTEFRDGEYVSLEKFEAYYGDEPQIDKIVYTVIPDSSAQEIAFRNGEINYLPLSTEVAASAYAATDGVTVHTIPEGRVKYLAWNKYCSTWDNRDAVAAVFAALNVDEIVAGAFGESMGSVANSIFSNRNLFHSDEVQPYAQDLDTAKQLAESSGLAGKTITLYYNQNRTYVEQMALVIQQQLKNIDVTVNVQSVESSAFFDIVFTDQADYELYINEYGASGDPDSVVAGMFDGTWGNNVDTPQEILDLFVEGRTTTDETQRASIYGELQQLAHDGNLVYPIAYPNTVFATTSNLQGCEYYTTTPLFEDYTKLYFE